jgi:hypothetical protein
MLHQQLLPSRKLVNQDTRYFNVSGEGTNDLSVNKESLMKCEFGYLILNQG